MLQKDDNEALVNRLKTGDQSAFERIYHLYKHPLFHFALRYLKDHELAEDALQDVFVKFWNARQSLDENLSVRGFLFTCMKRHVLNVIRTEQNRIKLAALASSEKPLFSNQTEEEVAYQESKSQIDKGIDTLSESRKKIFLLSVIEGYSNQEIAAMLDISEHTVRSQISQSSKYMRKFLNRVISLLFALSCIC